MENQITLDNISMNLSQFCDRFARYEIEPTRGTILDVLKQTREISPESIPVVLDLVRSKYHINMTF